MADRGSCNRLPSGAFTHRCGPRKERRSAVLTTTTDRSDPRTSAQEHVVFGWRRLVLLALASVFFGLGVLGAVLPGIPATPFLLLTSYFLVRSSPRLNARLLSSRVFGPILVDWQVHGGVRRHLRYKAIAAIVVAVGASIYILGYSLPASLSVVLLALIGIVVVLRLPAAKDP